MQEFEPTEVGFREFLNQAQIDISSWNGRYSSILQRNVAAGWNKLQAGVELTDAWFWSSMHYGYAAIMAGKVDGVEKVSGGFIVQPDMNNSLMKAVPELIAGYNHGRNLVDDEKIRDMFEDRVDLWWWYCKYFRIGIGDEGVDYMFKAPVVYANFDHFSEERRFIGGVCGYPSVFNRPNFEFLKAYGDPPICFFSKREQNDHPAYCLKRQQVHGFDTLFESAAMTGRHEQSQWMIDASVMMAKAGYSQTWLGEGIAQYCQDSDWWKKSIADVGELPEIDQIISREGKALDYQAALCLTMGLALNVEQRLGLEDEDKDLESMILSGVQILVSRIEDWAKMAYRRELSARESTKVWERYGPPKKLIVDDKDLLRKVYSEYGNEEIDYGGLSDSIKEVVKYCKQQYLA